MIPVFTTQPKRLLLGFIVTCFETLPDYLNVQSISCDQDVMIQRLEVEADEMARFVQKKANKQWIWLAMDAKTRQIIAFHGGIVAAGVPSACGRRFLKRTVNTPLFTPDQYVGYSRDTRKNET